MDIDGGIVKKGSNGFGISVRFSINFGRIFNEIFGWYHRDGFIQLGG